MAIVPGRIVLAWELGRNLGHLSRLVPLARQLCLKGHEVTVVARDPALAARMLADTAVRVRAAPVSGVPARLAAQGVSVEGGADTRGTGASRGSPVSYAELLLDLGWGDAVALTAWTRDWMTVLSDLGADRLVLDFAPGALLAARCLGVPVALLGTGFELPPLRTPFPAFAGGSAETELRVARSESRVIESINAAMRTCGGAVVSSLRDLFDTRRWLTTLPELDHYGARANEQYVGPIGEVPHGGLPEWPQGQGRALVYLRPQVPGLSVLLSALSASGMAVLCYAPGVADGLFEAVAGSRVVRCADPLRVRDLLRQSSVCLSYGSADLVAVSLLHAVPLVLCPVHTESFLTALRVEQLGAGRIVRPGLGVNAVSGLILHVARSRDFKVRAHMFAHRHRGFNAERAREGIVGDIEAMLR